MFGMGRCEGANSGSIKYDYYQVTTFMESFVERAPALTERIRAVLPRAIGGAPPEQAVGSVDPTLAYAGWSLDRYHTRLYKVTTEAGTPAMLKVCTDLAFLRYAHVEHTCLRDLTRCEVPGVPRFLRSYWPAPDQEGFVALLREYIAGETLNDRPRGDAVFDSISEMAIRMLGARYGLPQDLHHEQIIVTPEGKPYLIDLEEAVPCGGFSQDGWERDCGLIADLRREHRRVTGRPSGAGRRLLRLVFG